MLVVSSGCRSLTDEEILQHVKTDVQERLAKQDRAMRLNVLQELIVQVLRGSTGVKEASLVMEDSVVEEEHQNEQGKIIYKGRRNVIDFWVVLTLQADRKLEPTEAEGIVRRAFSKRGLEVETIWKPGRSGDQWGLNGWAVEPPKNPTAATLRICPDGHTRLRDVPIAYGYIIPDDDFLKKEANHEVIRGGCVVGPTKEVVLCLECGFRYDTTFKYWQLTSDKLVSLKRELSPLIVRVPFPHDAQPTYQQKIRAGNVGMDVVWFHSAQSPVSLSALFKKYLESQGLHVEEESRSWGDEKEQYFNLTSDLGNKKVRVVIMEHKITKSNSVHFEIGDDGFDLAAAEEETMMGGAVRQGTRSIP